MDLDDHLQGLGNAAAVSELSGMVFRCRNDPDWTLVYASDAVTRITGYSAAELSQGSMNWVSLLHPADVAPLRGIVAQAVQRGQPFRVEYRIRHRDGSQRWLCEQGRGIFDAAGSCVALEGFINDISGHKRNQSDLAAAKQLLDAHMENSPLAVIEFDAQLRVIRWSDEAEHLFGWRADEVLQRAIDALHWVHEEDQAGVAQLWADMLANRFPRNKHVNRNYRKDGSVVHCEWYNSAIYGDRGQLSSILSQVLDISERKQVEQELARSRLLAEQRAAELDALLQAVPAAVWIAHDGECSRVTGNRTAYEWVHMEEGAEFSLTETDGELPPCMKIRQDGRDLRVDELPLFQAAAGVEVRDCEEDIVLQDGSKRTAFGHAKPLWNEQGKPRGAIAAFVDITERKRAEEALKEADRRKNEFLALLAHELRNPLAPIRNAVAILRLKGSPDPVLQEARNMIDRQLQNLVRLVDDLLDVSRITHGKLQLRRTRVELTTVLEQALETVRPQLEQSGLALTVSLPGAAISLDADPARLAQVFLNLLSNAIKYSEPGGHIELSAELDGEEVVVQVRDNGIGILPEHLPRLFEMFAQLPTPPDRNQGGLGLGLALARSLVEMHGGHIEARSEGPGQGSEFSVRLPVLAAATENPPVEEARDELQPGTCRVLVADDKPDAVDSLVMLLRLSGHEVAIAHDGQEAVEVAARFRPDVALLDIGMPRLNGYDACRHIRQQPWGKDMTIIALTGWGQEEDLHNSKAAGFSSHLVKPVDPTALLQLLAAPRYQRA